MRPRKGKTPSPRPATLGSTVRRLRRERGLTQKELATFAGLDPAVISRIESGKAKQVWPQTVDRLASAFSVATGVLFGVVEPEMRLSTMPPTVREINALLKDMTDEDRVIVLSVARALDEKAKRSSRTPDSR